MFATNVWGFERVQHRRGFWRNGDITKAMAYEAAPLFFGVMGIFFANNRLQTPANFAAFIDLPYL